MAALRPSLRARVMAAIALLLGAAALFAAWSPLIFGSIIPVPAALIIGGLGSVFGGLFILGAIITLFPPRGQRLADDLRAQHPGMPRRWRPEWVEGRLPSGGGSQALVAWVPAGILNLLTLPALYFVISKAVTDGIGGAEASMGVFALLSVGSVGLAIHLTFRQRTFGTSVLELAATPAVPGRPLLGRIVARVKLRPTGGVRLTLMLVNRTRSADNDRTVTEIIHRHETRIVHRDLFEAEPGRTGIPVAFDLPADVRPTDESCENSEWHWRLEATAAIPGIDYSVKFDIPVFAAEPVRILPARDIEEIQAAASEAKPEPVPAATVEVHPIEAGGVTVFFPAGRLPKAAYVAGVFAVLFGGATGLMVLSGDPSAISFSSFFGLGAFGLGYLAFDQGVAWIRVTIRDGELVRERVLLRRSVMRFRCERIQDVFVAYDGFVGNRAMFALKLRLDAGHPVKVAGYFVRREEADGVAALLRDEVKKQAKAALSDPFS